ncbi:MAG TPA: hypothetical protein VFU22_11220 [Roseiflexaceae bacterium]|nr:hypothetical protein [Roseiflexaceae bacterium]
MTAYSSSEAAQMLSIAPITLRKLSSAFAAWLSPSAAGTVMAGEAWDRLYTDDDLDILRYVIVLLRQNRNYAWVRERLTVEYGAGEALTARDPSSGFEPEQPTGSEEPPAPVPEPSGAWQTEREKAPDMAETEGIELEYGAPRGAAYAEDAQVFESGDAQDDTPDEAPHVVDAEVVDPTSQVPPDIAAMLARIAELYQELLRNKDQEIAALRQALDVTELSAANERRELEMLNRLAKMMERENQRLTTELEEARRQLGQAPARRGWFARMFGGGDEETSSAQQI